MAKTLKQGNELLRMYALYSNSKGLTFYYTTPKGTTHSMLFNQPLNDGQRHRIVLWRWKQHIYLAVDGNTRVRQQLEANIGDCDSEAVSSCTFSIGQRRDIKKMVQWSLDGKLYSMTLVANKVVREYPTHARGGTQAHMVSSINLLDPAVHDARAQLRLGAYLFAPSRPGLELTTKTAKLALPAKLSVAVHFRLVPGTGGYLFAKTSQHGDVKHLAVYVSKSQRDVAVYCQIGGVPTRTRFKINLTDGKKYVVLSDT